MLSVTQFIKQHKQPRGGYLPRQYFSEIKLPEKDRLNDMSLESVTAMSMGLVVDYVSRLLMGETVREAFQISIRGAMMLRDMDRLSELLTIINHMDVRDITLEQVNALFEIVRYDTVYRAGISAYMRINAEDVIVTNVDRHNLQLMVNRTRRFLDHYGPVTGVGCTFEGGYTEVVSTGDMDFLTEGVLWDMKVSKNPPTAAMTMQLLCYYLLGQASGKSEFKDIKQLGIFNPRLNSIYLLPISHIPEETIETVKLEMGFLS